MMKRFESHLVQHHRSSDVAGPSPRDDFVKPLLGQDEEVVLKALRTNTAFFQREVAQRVTTKYAAKLKFLADESFDEGSHIDRILRSKHVAQDIEKE